MRLLPVPPEHLDGVFRIMHREVGSIASRSNGRLSASDLLEMARAGDLIVWAVADPQINLVAIVLAEIRLYPRAKVCRLVGCAGRDRKSWLPLLSEIERWAASVGCTQMHAEARKGWAGELSDYRVTHILLEKDLVHVERRIEDAAGELGERAVERTAAVP
jgi:hypothetical protein